MLGRVAVQAARVGSRSMSSAAPALPAALHVDWAMLRSKMISAEAKEEADKAKESFTKRVDAALAASGPAEIDWARYKTALPDIDVDALRADYEKFFAAIPAQTYDEAADKAAHEAKETAWGGFAKFCQSRIAEIQKLAEEQKEHKLHRWYRRRRVFNRFPGLYESLHHRVRTYENDIWATRLAYVSRTVQYPWDASVGEVTDERKKEILKEIAEKSGLTEEQVGLEKK